MAQAKKPVMDVAKPGKTPAGATSRPIIVGHGPAIKDPMVNDGDTPQADVDTEEKQPLQASHKVITPITDTADSESVRTSKDASDSDDKPKEAEPEGADESDELTDDAVVDAVIDQVADKKQSEKVDDAAIKRQELVEQLVSSKKYFLPINSIKRRRNSRLAIVLVAALLPLLIGLVLAIDAGVLLPEVTLPFDLIK